MNISNAVTSSRVPIIGLSSVYVWSKEEWLATLKRNVECKRPPVCYGDFREMLFTASHFGNLPDGMWLDQIDLQNQNVSKCRGIYFCERSVSGSDYEDEHFVYEVCYIGKTNNFKKRFQNHHKMQVLDLLSVNSVLFLAMDDEYSEADILWTERQYINLLRPLLNDRSSLVLKAGSTEGVEQISNFRAQSLHV